MSRPLRRSESIWLLDVVAAAVRLQASRVQGALATGPSAPATADLWLFAVSVAKFDRVLDRLAGQRPSTHRIRHIRDELAASLPDLSAVRNALEHSEDYLRGAGGLKRDQTLRSLQVAVSCQEVIIAVSLAGGSRQLFLPVNGALAAVNRALSALQEPPSQSSL